MGTPCILKIKVLLFSCSLIAISGCRPATDVQSLMRQSISELRAGNLETAETLADSVRKLCGDNYELRLEADSVSEIAPRIARDFSLTEEHADSLIEKYSGPFSVEDKVNWEKRGWLEYRMVNGRKMYFNRAVSNLFLLKKFHDGKDMRKDTIRDEGEMAFRLKHTTAVFRSSSNYSGPVVPVTMEITYTITVHPGVVPDGEMIRCWMPWPKSGYPRQKKIELLGSSGQQYFISPDTAVHSTFYMEQKAREGLPAIFSISFRYESGAQYADLSSMHILPYEKESENYKKYTAEQPPQIMFSERIRALADSITGNEAEPAMIVRKIYMWFKNNIPWAGALEYSIMPDIPEYVIQHRRGDCGMQTLLYISMLRYKGIPVRWQSGWMVPPGAENLHDWCEIYFEGPGWVPSDVSYDLQNTGNKKLREFYLSGIDSYRLIVNNGIAGNLYPAKHFMRSEPYDFQRGEVEWRGGNLYFDKWDYNMKIEYLR